MIDKATKLENEIAQLKSTLQRRTDALNQSKVAITALLENVSGNTLWSYKAQKAWWEARKAINAIASALDEKGSMS